MTGTWNQKGTIRINPNHEKEDFNYVKLKDDGNEYGNVDIGETSKGTEKHDGGWVWVSEIILLNHFEIAETPDEIDSRFTATEKQNSQIGFANFDDAVVHMMKDFKIGDDDVYGQNAWRKDRRCQTS